MEIIATQSNGSGKFVDPEVTVDGKTRACVSLQVLRTLWFNTGTLCNLTCENCYIESSPSNDRLVYLSREEAVGYLEEIALHDLPVTEIGITGGEPFLNPDILPMLENCLAAGFSVLVLTNAMRPMMKCADGLLILNQRFVDQLTIRVSVDHYEPVLHEEERGRRTWQPMIEGLKWLSENKFQVHVAGRTRWEDDEGKLRAGYARFFDEIGVEVHAHNPDELVLFPEMDEHADVPEITTECWGILGVDPNQIMCASARMVVKRKGAMRPEVLACTLLPYDTQFSTGPRLADSLGTIALNHPHCARFCVLGGGSCSR